MGRTTNVSLLSICLLSALLLAAEPSTKERPRLETMTAAERAEWITNLSPGEKAELLRKAESFRKLDDPEREKLRRLHDEIENDNDAAELRGVMHNYYDWWKSLPKQYDRAELSSLPPKERIERIKKLVQEERNRNPAKLLPPADIAVLREWMEKRAKEFEDRVQEYQKKLSPEKRKDWDAKTPEQRRWEVHQQLWLRGGNKPPPMPDAFANLRSKFTPETQTLLDGMRSHERWVTIQGWLHWLAQQKMGNRPQRRSGPFVDDADLEEYFAGDQIDREERERLLNLPPEQMHNQLQQLYLSRNRQFEPMFRGPEGSPPGRPGGPFANPERKRPKSQEEKPEKAAAGPSAKN